MRTFPLRSYVVLVGVLAAVAFTGGCDDDDDDYCGACVPPDVALRDREARATQAVEDFLDSILDAPVGEPDPLSFYRHIPPLHRE